jgi:hypothetical protein
MGNHKAVGTALGDPVKRLSEFCQGIEDGALCPDCDDTSRNEARGYSNGQ